MVKCRVCKGKMKFWDWLIEGGLHMDISPEGECFKNWKIRRDEFK